MNTKYILSPYTFDEVEEDMFDLAEPSWEVIQPIIAQGTMEARLTSLYLPLRDSVAEVVSAGERPVSVAGDCCTSIGVLAGLQQGGIEPSLIWFDAHGDFNTWESTPSGFIGGMPLAMLVGLGDQSIVDGVGMVNLPAEKVILTDARDLDPGEKEAVAGSGLTHLTDVGELIEMPLPAGPIWVHFDVDVLNTNELPAVGYPAPGGPSADLLRRVFEHIAQSGRIVAVSLSSWNDELDPDGRSRELSMELLSVLVG